MPPGRVLFHPTPLAGVLAASWEGLLLLLLLLLAGSMYMLKQLAGGAAAAFGAAARPALSGPAAAAASGAGGGGELSRINSKSTGSSSMPDPSSQSRLASCSSQTGSWLKEPPEPVRMGAIMVLW